MGAGGSTRAFYDSSLSDQLQTKQAENQNGEDSESGPSSPIDLQQINAVKGDLDSFHIPFPMNPSILHVPYYSKYPFQDYRFMKKIGTGRFSTVFKAYKLENRFKTSERVAIKEIEANTMSPIHYEDLRYEMSLLSQLAHPIILRLLCVYEPPTINAKLYVVYEYIRGGELFSSIIQQSHYTLYDLLHCFQQVLSGLQYLHSLGVIHGNLIPESIVLVNKYNATTRSENRIKLVGFDHAESFDGFGKHRPLHRSFKELFFVSPERRSLDKTSDLTSINNGRSFFPLTSGTHPSSQNSLFRALAANDIWSFAAIFYFLISGDLPIYEMHHNDSNFRVFRSTVSALLQTRFSLSLFPLCGGFSPH